MSEDVFFTADMHFNHEKILWLGNGRPHASVEEMNEALIENWNNRVQRGDRVYFLGDMSFANSERTEMLVGRLQGQIHVVRGNHDRPLDRLRDRFASFGDYKNIRVNGQTIILSHYPFAEWHNCHKGTWHLHGHQHGNGPPTSLPRIDVGVDCFDFAPVSFEELAVIMADREWEQLSHH